MGDLQQFMKRPLPEREVKDIISQILEGLSLMHDNGFTHRDLKPAVRMNYAPCSVRIEAADDSALEHIGGGDISSMVGEDYRFRDIKKSRGVFAVVYSHWHTRLSCPRSSKHATSASTPRPRR